MSKKKKIAILGCGWVGNALQEVLELGGDEVNCLSRDINMDTLVGFYDCDALIVAIPPSDEYLSVIDDAYFSTSLNEAIDTQVIFLSSISFYDNNKMIKDAEELAKIKNPDTVILRLGGLMGYDRVAGKYTIGKTVEDAPTNYVHRDDVVGIIKRIVERRVKNKIFNVIAPIQTTKKEIYTQNSKQFNFDETYFSKTTSKHNTYNSKILCDTLEYEFEKKDVKEFWKD